MKAGTIIGISGGALAAVFGILWWRQRSAGAPLPPDVSGEPQYNPIGDWEQEKLEYEGRVEQLTQEFVAAGVPPERAQAQAEAEAGPPPTPSTIDPLTFTELRNATAEQWYKEHYSDRGYSYEFYLEMDEGQASSWKLYF